jgi:hypothetical protein
VRKLRVNSQPGEQAQALLGILKASFGDEDFQAALVAADIIPLLMPLLGPGSAAAAQHLAAGVLALLSAKSDNVVQICAAGAIPLLVKMLEPSSPVRAQVSTAGALMRLSTNSAEIAKSWCHPSTGAVSGSWRWPPATMQGVAAATLSYIAVDAEDAATITSAGAIPLLVQLLKPSSPADGVLHSVAALSVLSAKNAATIAAAGAIPLLVQLSRSGSDDVQSVASRALEAIRNGCADNRAAAKASAGVVQAMEGLGVDGPSGAQAS